LLGNKIHLLFYYGLTEKITLESKYLRYILTNGVVEHAFGKIQWYLTNRRGWATFAQMETQGSDG
jgi:hypothetical protein